jgi:hypothetical protein
VTRRNATLAVIDYRVRATWPDAGRAHQVPLLRSRRRRIHLPPPTIRPTFPALTATYAPTPLPPPTRAAPSFGTLVTHADTACPTCEDRVSRSLNRPASSDRCTNIPFKCGGSCPVSVCYPTRRYRLRCGKINRVVGAGQPAGGGTG